MKAKMYTKSHDKFLLKNVDNDGGQFTADEHAYVTEKEYGDIDKLSFIQGYLSGNYEKLASLPFLIKHIETKGFKNILSLGAGQCVLEWLLQQALPLEVKVTACDFDSFFVNKARECLPGIRVEQYDFFKDSIDSLQDKIGVKFDLVIFYGSAYVMDDPDFIKQLSALKKGGVKQIIDFHAGFIPLSEVFRKYIISILSRVKRMVSKALNREKPDWKGKFHGYGRSHRELTALYKKADFRIVKELSLANYKYIAILEA